jgi:hypothetical protein
MPYSAQLEIRNHHREFSSRYYCACLLCVLLALFCVDARIARYVAGEKSLRLVTTQSFLDGDLARLELLLNALLLFGAIACAHQVVSPAIGTSLAALIALHTPHQCEFDSASHLRSPPIPS